MEPGLSKILILMLAVCSTQAMQYKGINFVSTPYTQAPYRHKNAKLSLEHLKETGANWISIPVAFFQEETDASELRSIETPMSTRDRINATPTKQEIDDVVTMAKNLDLKVMLMAQVEINRPGFQDSKWIGDHFSPYEFRRWFKYYTKLVVNLAKIAQENGTDLLCVGHNLNVLAHQEIYWNELIDQVRAVYKGKLTYSASSKNEFKKSGFWGKLDYVGLIADFDYKNHHRLTSEELQGAIGEFVKSADYMAKVWKKPVLITRAFSHSAKDVVSNNKVAKITHETQATFYKSLMEALKSHHEVKGIFWGDWVADHRFGGTSDGSLSPQLKPSELVLREYYGGEQSLPKKIEEKSEHILYCMDCHSESEFDL